MRCRLCDIPHKNAGNRSNWIELRLCRICFQIMDLFSYNSNYLTDYWEGYEK